MYMVILCYFHIMTNGQCFCNCKHKWPLNQCSLWDLFIKNPQTIVAELFMLVQLCHFIILQGQTIKEKQMGKMIKSTLQ